MNITHTIPLHPQFYTNFLERPSEEDPSETLDPWNAKAPFPSVTVSSWNVAEKVWFVFQFVLNVFFLVTGLIFASAVTGFILSKVEKWFRGEEFQCALYEDLVLSGSHRHLVGASTACLLAYVHDFLQRQEGIPEALMAEIAQAVEWGRHLEAVGALSDFEAQQKELSLLVENFISKLHLVKEGESILMGGGIQGELMEMPLEGTPLQGMAPKIAKNTHHVFYRITKQDDGGFSLQISSRDPQLMTEAHLDILGTDYLIPHLQFKNLTADQIGDPILWQALFSLYISDGEKEGFGTLDSLKKLLTPFQPHLTPPPADTLAAFRPSIASPNLYKFQNIWDLVHSQTGEKSAARRELFLSLETLFHYFHAVHGRLGDFSHYRFYLNEGLRLISQKIALYQKKGWMTNLECQSLEPEFAAIQKAIEASEQAKHASTSTSLPWFRSAPTVDVKIETVSSPLSKEITLPYVPTIALKEAPPTSSHIEVARLPTPLEPSDETWDCSSTLFQLEPKEHLIPTRLVEFVDQIQKIEAPLHRQYAILKMVEALPNPSPFYRLSPQEFEEVIQNLKSKDTEEVIEDTDEASRSYHFLNHLSQHSPPSEIVATIRAFTQLFEILTESALESCSPLPDRIAAGLKLFYYSQCLARLDQKNSLLTDEFALCEDEGYTPMFGHSYGIGFATTPAFRKRSVRYDSLIETLSALHESHQKRATAAYNQSISVALTPHQYNDIFSDFEKYRRTALTPHLECLKTQLELFNKLLNPAGHFKYERSYYWYRTLFRDMERGLFIPFIGSWGRTIENRYLLQKASGLFHVGDYYSSINHHVTQEAIVDDPVDILSEEDVSYEMRPALAGKSTDISLTRSQIRNLLLSLTDHDGLTNLVALIKRDPSVLEDTDVCALIEMRFSDPHIFNQNVADNPHFQKDIELLLDESILEFEKKQLFREALFLVRLKTVLSLIEPQLLTSTFQDFLRLKSWHSLSPDSGYYPHRHTVAMDYLLSLLSKDLLTSAEIRDIFFFYFVFKSAPVDAPVFDPSIADLISARFFDKFPALSQYLKENPNLQNHLLDTICQSQGVRLPNSPWIEEDASSLLFTSEGIEIDLLGGMCNDSAINGSLRALDPIILRSADFRRLFPQVAQMQPKVAFSLLSDGTKVYAFLDSSGTENRIEVKHESVKCYKKIGEDWALYLSPSVFGNKLENSLPAPILDQFFYVSTVNPYQVYVCNSSHELQMKIYLEKPWSSLIWNDIPLQINSVNDLRPGRDIFQNMQLSKLSYLDPPFLHPLLAFEESSQILVWSKGTELKGIELPRFNLNFEVRDKKLVCISPPFENYTVASNPQDYQLTGLPVFLLLTPPSNKEAAKLLIPQKAKSQPIDLFPSFILGLLPQMNPLTRWITSWFVSDLSLYPKHLWIFEPQKKQDYWAFDLENQGAIWTSRSNGHTFAAYADTLLFALTQSCIDAQKASAQVHWLLSQIQTIPQELVDPAVFQSLVLNIAASTPTRLSTEPYYPEIVALGLQALLVLREKALASQEAAVEETIANLGKIYFSKKHFASVPALLPKDQKQSVLNAIQKLDPSSFKEIDALLSQSGAGISRTVTTLPFFTDQPLLDTSSRVRTLARKILEDASSKEVWFSKNPQRVLQNFKRVYEALRQPIDSSDFRKAAATLDLATVKENDASQVVRFFQMLVELRQKTPDAPLPALPDLPFPPHNFESAATYDQTKKIRDDSVQTLEAFIGALPKDPLAAPVPTPADNSNAPTPSSDPLNWEESSLIEALEKQVQSSIKAPLSLLSHPQANSALFELSDIEGFFEHLPPPEPINLSLHALDDHPEPGVRALKASIEQSLELYEKTLSSGSLKKYKITGLPNIKQNLLEKVQSYRELAAQKKAHIFSLIDLSESHFSSFERMGQLHPKTSWLELKIAFLQGELAKVCGKLPQLSLETLQKSLTAYLEAETLHRHALFCLTEVENIERENLQDSPDAGEKLFHLLTRCRGYDVTAFPPLLVVEETLGFLVSSAQIEMVQNLLQDPHSIARAITGAGKTSVIMLLLGLLKADGSNLVTLKFLDPLFPENSKTLHRSLGNLMQKKVMTLLFSAKTALKEQGSQVSIFKKMYERLLKTVLEKGCVLTDRRSMPLLEAKFISLLDKIAFLKETHQKIEPTDLEHIYYLSRILKLFKERQECIYDEHDKALYPREEIHLSLGSKAPPPKFMIDTVKQVYAYLGQHPSLKNNTQADLSEEERGAILKTTALQLAGDWAETLKLSKATIFDYFTGQSEALLPLLEEQNEESWKVWKDQLALTKDLFLTYLPITLSHTGRNKYILSQDGVSVIPCEYSNTPKEGSLFDNIIERLAYTVQSYCQTGVSNSYLKQWMKTLREEAFKEIEADASLRFENTHANDHFKAVFGKPLPHVIHDTDVEWVANEVRQDQKKLYFYLDQILPEIEIYLEKISMDAQNQVSMSSASAGISATHGCLHGLHPTFTLPSETDFMTGQMLDRMMRRLNEATIDQAVLLYDSASSQTVIAEVIKQAPTTKVIIDGAGALWGMTPQEAAEQLLQSQGDSLASVGYFDRDGNPLFAGSSVSTLSTRGQVFSHAQSRGANVILSPSHRAVLMAHGRSPLEELCQNEGRLRNPDQRLAFAVPEKSGIQTVKDLIYRSLTVQGLEESDNVYRSELQMLRDVIRREMLDKLLQATISLDPQIESLFYSYRKTEFLISKKNIDWDEPGHYFAAHRQIQKKETPAEASLTSLQQEYLKICQELGLERSQKILASYDFEKRRPYRIEYVWNTGGLTTDQQVLIETEVNTTTETEVQTEVSTEVVASQNKERRAYYSWLRHYDSSFKQHSYRKKLQKVYDSNLFFSENFLPISSRSGKETRFPHDPRQNRLHHVRVAENEQHLKDYSKWPFTETIQKDWKFYAYDELDASNECRSIRYKYKLDKSLTNPMYDTHLHRFIRGNLPEDTEAFRAAFSRALAQMRFEDGQYEKRLYLDAEWEALKTWIQAQEDLPSLETYFQDEILKNRPIDRQRYLQSDLYNLFHPSV